MAARCLAMKRAVIVTIRLIVAAVFVVAGVGKAQHPAAFIQDIWNYRLVPEPWAYWIAALVPYLEIVAGLALATGMQRRGAHVILLGLLVAFVVFLGSAWGRGLDIACGCFGAGAPGETDNLPWLMVRNLLLIGGVVVSAWAERSAPPARAT